MGLFVQIWVDQKAWNGHKEPDIKISSPDDSEQLPSAKKSYGIPKKHHLPRARHSSQADEPMWNSSHLNHHNTDYIIHQFRPPISVTFGKEYTPCTFLATNKIDVEIFNLESCHRDWVEMNIFTIRARE